MRYFCKMPKEMQLTSGSASLGTSLYTGPGSEETWNFEKCPDNPKGNGMNWPTKFWMCIVYRTIQS